MQDDRLIKRPFPKRDCIRKQFLHLLHFSVMYMII